MMDAMSTRIHTSTNVRLLHMALQFNVGFSTASGLLLTLGAPWLDDLLGPAPWILAGVGIGLLVFAAAIHRGAQQAPVTTARLALTADLAWMAATVVLAPLAGSFLTSIGKVVAVGVAFVVLDLAIAEGIGLRKALR